MITEADVRKYLPLVRWNLRTYRHAGEYDDLLQEGTLAIVEALQETSVSDQSVKRAINRRLKRAHRDVVRQRSKEVYLDREEGTYLLEMEVQGSDDPSRVVDRIWFDSMISQLSGREHQCAALYFGDGLTQQEIAQQLDLRQQTVSLYLQRGIARLRKLAR